MAPAHYLCYVFTLGAADWNAADNAQTWRQFVYDQSMPARQ